MDFMFYINFQAFSLKPLGLILWLSDAKVCKAPLSRKQSERRKVTE